MKTASEIINEVRNLKTPNKGVEALFKAAGDDNEFCIMDDSNSRKSYRCECPDASICAVSIDFMLACVQTRYSNQLGDTAIEIYNESTLEEV